MCTNIRGRTRTGIGQEHPSEQYAAIEGSAHARGSATPHTHGDVQVTCVSAFPFRSTKPHCCISAVLLIVVPSCIMRSAYPQLRAGSLVLGEALRNSDSRVRCFSASAPAGDLSSCIIVFLNIWNETRPFSSACFMYFRMEASPMPSRAFAKSVSVMKPSASLSSVVKAALIEERAICQKHE